MITTLLATGLLLTAAPTGAPAQDPAPDAARVGLTDVTSAQKRFPRIHVVPSPIDAGRRKELEATLSDPDTPGAVRAAAHADYLMMLEQGTAVAHAERLAEAIEALLRPEFEAGGPTIRSTFDGSGLLVDGTEAEHGAIARMLASLESETRQILVEATIYRLPEEELFRVTGRGSAQALDEGARERLMGELESYDRLSTPSVATRPGSKASITAGDQIAYIADFEVMSLPERDAEIADPVVKTVFDGILLEVRAAPLGDAMRLEVRFESSELQRPIPTQELTLSPGAAKVTIQRPVVTAIETSALFDLAYDGTVALRATDPTGAGGEGALILLRARLVEPANGGVRFEGR